MDPEGVGYFRAEVLQEYDPPKGKKDQRAPGHHGRRSREMTAKESSFCCELPSSQDKKGKRHHIGLIA